jgi:hypothetical protein
MQIPVRMPLLVQWEEQKEAKVRITIMLAGSPFDIANDNAVPGPPIGLSFVPSTTNCSVVRLTWNPPLNNGRVN